MPIFTILSWANAGPPPRPASVVAAVPAIKVRRSSLMLFSLLFRLGEPRPVAEFLFWSAPRMAKRPHQEVIADIVVDLGEAERLQHQKADDQRAVEHQRDMRAQIAAEREAGRARDGADQIVQHDRREQDECRAEETAEHAAKTADDDHRND